MTNLSINKQYRAGLVRFKNKYLPLYVMLIPFVVYFILFKYKPMAGIAIAFQDYSVFKGMLGSEWVGFKHFEAFLSSPYFVRVLKNTIVLNLCCLVTTFPAPIVLALLLNEVKERKLKSTIQTLTYMPHFISTVVIAGIVINLLSPSYGLITNVVEKFTGERIYFITKPEYFRTIYITMNLWQSMGYDSIVFLAAIAGIDVQLYEAAAIDGASKLKRVWHVTLPGMLPTIMTMLLIRIGGLLSSSTESILLLYQPATYEVSDVIGTYVYREGLDNANYSFATAVGLFNSVIALMLVGAANWTSNKLTKVGLW